MDYYAVLQINRNCTKEDIRKAFLKLARVHHPDKGGDEKEFKKINEAYQYLMKHHGEFQPQQFGKQRGRTIVYHTNGVTMSYTMYY